MQCCNNNKCNVDFKMASMTRVFVYGTLKRNFPNHKLLANVANDQFVDFVSNAKTLNRYPLIVATRANIPFLLDAPSKGQHVLGEVYQVCKKTLAALDELENEGILYNRKKIPVVLSDVNFNDEQVDVFAYVLTDFKEYLLSLPLLPSFTKEHALQYRSKRDRESDQENILSVVKN